ncbi:MAG: ABC transporter ATP-binding protein, partial [Clostridia bacterium]|nr:ABC transporter ATP-binding protein [Clostridia bacterium]
ANPSLLIMDDSLSAVDTVTEAEILRNLKVRSAGCSVMLITHRISAAMLSDKVLFLTEDGTVEAFGHHDELLSSSPAYRYLFENASGITAEGGSNNG